MIAVILLMVPLTIPKLFGLEIYGVLTESMTPSYSVGGVVYVEEAEVSDIQIGDVITYRMGTDTEYVMTHRVVEMDASSFITKGDANNTVDSEPISYDRLIGKVVFFLPGLASVAEFVNSLTGCSILVILFSLAFIFWVVADMLAPSKKKKVEDTKEKKKYSSIWMQGIGVVCILGAVLYIGSVFFTYRESTLEYKELESEVFEGMIAVGDAQLDKGEALTTEERAILEKIGELHEENPEVIGWIKFDNLELSYPIMQGEDNDYYLNHTFSGEENSSGSIFLEATNTSDFNDSHTIIYGHNMKNQSMFGALKNYKTEDFYSGNEYFTIYTLDRVYRYQIFAYYDIPVNSEIYRVNFAPDEEFQQILDNMCRRSYENTEVRADCTDKVVTLSTCSTKGNRFVVNAKRISEKNK